MAIVTVGHNSNDSYAPLEENRPTLAEQWAKVQAESIHELRMTAQVVGSYDERRQTGCRYTSVQLRHLFETAREELVHLGSQCPSMSASTFLALGLVDGALSRANEQGAPALKVATYLGSANVAASILEKVMERHPEETDAVELGRLRDLYAMFQAVKEG